MATRRRRHARRSGPGFAGLILLLVVLAAVAALVVKNVFVVGDIQVLGNRNFSSEDIINIAGVEMGESIFSVSGEKIAQKFDTVGRIHLEEVEIRWPGTVCITVRERTARFLVNYLGLISALDEYGYVIEQSTELPGYQLVVVTGLNAQSCQVGRKVTSTQIGQVDAMLEVINSLYRMQADELVSELNVLDLDNMYLMTRSGMMVKIGDSTLMDQKIAWMIGVLPQLEAEGSVSGVLDVSGGSSAVYQPPSE